MRNLLYLIKKGFNRHHPEKGQGLVEYALILGFAALVVLAIVNALEFSFEDVFSRIAGNAPVAPPSLLSYTPPPTYTPRPTEDPNATEPPIATATDPANPPTATDEAEPTLTHTPTATATPVCIGYSEYAIPGRVQMENFRCGGSAVAFADSTGDGGPGSGSYRTDVSTEGPDLAAKSGGYYMGWFTNGEWVKYDVKVTTSQLYNITFLAASNNGDGRFRLEFINNGQVIYTSPSITVPDSGGNQSWTNVVVSDVPFVQGSNQIIIITENKGFNLDYFEAELAAVAPTLTNTPVSTATEPPPTQTPPPTEPPPTEPPPTETPMNTATPVPENNCTIYESGDVPKNLQDKYYQGRWRTGRTTSEIKITDRGTITDINILNITGTHTYFGDLDFNLIGPGDSIKIIEQTCDNYTDNFSFSLDDEAASELPTCPPTSGGTYQPAKSLSAFVGENMKDTWELRIDDNARYDVGTLTGWSLEICIE